FLDGERAPQPRGSMSNLPEKLVEAYRSTLYVVWPFGPEERRFTLCVGKEHPELDAVMGERERGAVTWAMLTAYNPGSKENPAEVNHRAQQRLRDALEASALCTWPGAGEDPKGAWKAEPMWLAVGITRERALELGAQFGQNAILFG